MLFSNIGKFVKVVLLTLCFVSVCSTSQLYAAAQTLEEGYLVQPEGVRYEFDEDGGLIVYVPPLREFSMENLPPRVRELFEKNGVKHPDASWTAKATPEFFVSKDLPGELPALARGSQDKESLPSFTPAKWLDEEVAPGSGVEQGGESFDVIIVKPSSQI